jgi:hypothetical protein
VLLGATPPPLPTLTVESVPSSIPTLTAVPITPQIVFPFTAVPTQAEIVENRSANSGGSSSFLVILVILASFVGGGVAMWLIRDPKS